MPEKKTRLITHSIEKMLYKLGDLTDPISGKKIVMSRYRYGAVQWTKIDNVLQDSTNNFATQKDMLKIWHECILRISIIRHTVLLIICFDVTRVKITNVITKTSFLNKKCLLYLLLFWPVLSPKKN